jgi:hypothetical protein
MRMSEALFPDSPDTSAVASQKRYECPEHGNTLREQQALGPYCYECHGRVDPVISRG